MGLFFALLVTFSYSPTLHVCCVYVCIGLSKNNPLHTYVHTYMERCTIQVVGGSHPGKPLAACLARQIAPAGLHG
ncbi:uncharacterized protein GGS25DRAFT_496334 [Hypoxylon fragiforme]|uniref:uncharacterized protein n=1 Tax=Hypoxylon fragiforme TaxID=63214 RepID=UPI0020C5BD6D|nr:uncharacterized protein GGS25DRAFT_496334 [Hypoxylon fragiforme]KAI2607533.1 hypothetical protein GGS25DRAFT_496334 [Hypoxylon fragiforme]